MAALFLRVPWTSNARDPESHLCHTRQLLYCPRSGSVALPAHPGAVVMDTVISEVLHPSARPLRSMQSPGSTLRPFSTTVSLLLCYADSCAGIHSLPSAGFLGAPHPSNDDITRPCLSPGRPPASTPWPTNIQIETPSPRLVRPRRTTRLAHANTVAQSKEVVSQRPTPLAHVQAALSPPASSERRPLPICLYARRR